MDVNDLRKIFGNMPIEVLPAAQMLQKKKTRNIFIGVACIGSLLFGAYLMNEYHKYKDIGNDKKK